jgi:hypothetical protein
MFHDPFLFYLSQPALICFDDQDATPTSDPPSDPPPNDPPQPPKTFTQEDLNKFLAEDRRKTEAKYKAELSKAEKNYQELLENKNLTEQDRTRLQESLEDVRKQLRTKEQQLSHEKKQVEEQYSTRLKEAEQKATHWETQYREEKITRAIVDAAVSEDAFRPEQIVLELFGKTKLVEDIDEITKKPAGKHKVVVDFPDVAENGDPIMTQRTPREAVKRMKELSDLYGNLFKSGIVSGIGGSSGQGGVGTGHVDVSKLTPEQYMKLRKENPQALGLAPKR